MVGDCNGSGNAETVCKHIADLPIVDLHQVLTHYDTFDSFSSRIDADVIRMQAQL